MTARTVPPVVPIVLLHGVGLDHTMWAPLQGFLSSPTITYDLLGLGDSHQVRGPLGLSDYVQQFHEKVPHSEAAQVDLVGFSMGALIAQAVAVAAPLQVRRLVLINGVHRRTDDEQNAILSRVAEVREGGYLDRIEPALQRWFTPTFASNNPSIVETVRQRMIANPVESYAHAYSVFATADTELAEQTKTISAPTLVITGEDDARSTPAMAHALVVRRGFGEGVECCSSSLC